jgi:hypothetical protein
VYTLLDQYQYAPLLFARFVLADHNSLLSPTARSAPVYLYPLFSTRDQSWTMDEARNFYRRAEQVTRALGGVPHWGKVWFDPVAGYASMERFEQFADVRQQLDPFNMFALPALPFASAAQTPPELQAAAGTKGCLVCACPQDNVCICVMSLGT